MSRKLLRAIPGQNLINFQLECNRNLECNRTFQETAQSQPKSESHRFSFRIELEHEGSLYGLIVWSASLAPVEPKL